jgi:hypothetical protein
LGIISGARVAKTFIQILIVACVIFREILTAVLAMVSVVTKTVLAPCDSVRLDIIEIGFYVIGLLARFTVCPFFLLGCPVFGVGAVIAARLYNEIFRTRLRYVHSRVEIRDNESVAVSYL